MSSPTPIPESHTTLVPTPPETRAAAPAKLPKSPGLALLFALVPPPGLGQMYNGQMAKAMVVFFAFTGSIWACVESGPLPFAFFIPFTIFFGAIDAYRSAALHNARFVSGQAIEEEPDGSSPAWGVMLIVLGCVFLLNNLGWLPLATLHRFWPLLLIGAGVFFLYGARTRKATDATGGNDVAL